LQERGIDLQLAVLTLHEFPEYAPDPIVLTNALDMVRRPFISRDHCHRQGRTIFTAVLTSKSHVVFHRFSINTSSNRVSNRPILRHHGYTVSIGPGAAEGSPPDGQGASERWRARRR
jgi:hypothetical protein